MWCRLIWFSSYLSIFLLPSDINSTIPKSVKLRMKKSEYVQLKHGINDFKFFVSWFSPNLPNIVSSRNCKPVMEVNGIWPNVMFCQTCEQFESLRYIMHFTFWEQDMSCVSRVESLGCWVKLNIICSKSFLTSCQTKMTCSSGQSKTCHDARTASFGWLWNCKLSICWGEIFAWSCPKEVSVLKNSVFTGGKPVPSVSHSVVETNFRKSAIKTISLFSVPVSVVPDSLFCAYICWIEPWWARCRYCCSPFKALNYFQARFRNSLLTKLVHQFSFPSKTCVQY